MSQLNTQIKPNHRNTSIDSFRGFAVLVMIVANAWPSLFPFSRCPLGLRILFSIAAPLFIFLSGASVCLAEEAGKSSSVLLKRIVQVLIIGVIIDALVVKIAPFYTFDVLYLITFSLLIILILRQTPHFVQWTTATVLLVGNVFLLDHYQFDITTLSLSGDALEYSTATAFRQFVLDGWFPLLPWAGVACFGYLLCKKRNCLDNFSKAFLVAGSAVILLSIVIYTINSENIQPLRDGYTELFYPVKNFYWLLLSGLIFISISTLNASCYKPNFLSRIGSKSLFMYLLHIIIIEFLIPLFNQDAESFQVWISIGVFLGYIAFLNAFHYVTEPFIKSLKYGKMRMFGYILGF